MTEITFQKVSLDDIQTFLDLEKKVSHLQIYSGITDEGEAREEIEDNEVYFIKKDNRIVGSTAYQTINKDEAYFSGLVIDPSFQGQGIARAAIEFRLNTLKDKKRLWLVTHPHNSKVIRLYLSYGFFIEAWKDNYYGDGEPRLVLALNRSLL